MENWSASDVLAVLGGVAAAVVAIITAYKTGAKVDKVTDIVETVELNTNSRATKQDDLISDLSSQIKVLTAHVAEQEKNRAVLAAEAKTVTSQAPVTIRPA